MIAADDVLIENPRNAQVQIRIDPERQSGDDGDGKRYQQSGAVHGGLYIPIARLAEAAKNGKAKAEPYAL